MVKKFQVVKKKVPEMLRIMIIVMTQLSILSIKESIQISLQQKVRNVKVIAIVMINVHQD
jgi:hypothetical protein